MLLKTGLRISLYDKSRLVGCMYWPTQVAWLSHKFVVWGSILRNTISAEKFSSKFLSYYSRHTFIHELHISIYLTVMDTILVFNDSKSQ
jgi:hypothetical protein